MVRAAVVVALTGTVFAVASTMTAMPYSTWLWLNSAFGLLVMGTAFVVAMKSHGRAAWARGFGAGALGLGASVAVLLAFVSAAANQLTQLPYEHYDIASSGAATVSEFLRTGGWTTLWTETVFSAGVMLVPIALVAVAGAFVGRLSHGSSREITA